jgi:hypothetical protein
MAGHLTEMKQSQVRIRHLPSTCQFPVGMPPKMQHYHDLAPEELAEV